MVHKRGRREINFVMLRACKKPATAFAIMKEVGACWNSVQSWLGWLIKRGWVEKRVVDIPVVYDGGVVDKGFGVHNRKDHCVYVLTDEGSLQLIQYVQDGNMLVR